MNLGAPFVPFSSPPSSPSIGPTDSSPASSPALQPNIHDSPRNIAGPSHPFAASSRSDRLPPLYEKKFALPPSALPANYISSMSGSRAFEKSYEDDEYLNENASGRPPNRVPADPEALLWDEAISSAIDRCSGTINLACVP
jgi:hypothetical protein